MERWARIAFSFDWVEYTLFLVASHQKDNRLLSQEVVYLQTVGKNIFDYFLLDIAYAYFEFFLFWYI